MELLTDCARCRRSTTRLVRQSMGCGYEPPAPRGLPAVAWQHPGDDGDELTTCPGYTCNLPEVIHASRARLHWSKGQLEAFTGGPPRAELLLALEVLEVATNRAQDWHMQNPPGA
jgi:hypothetical protein